MKLFLLMRLLGLAMILDGLCTVFTPYKASLSLKAARHIARTRYGLQKEQQ